MQLHSLLRMPLRAPPSFPLTRLILMSHSNLCHMCYSTNEFSKYLRANGFANPRIVNHFLEYEATLKTRREELLKAGYRNKSEVARPGVVFMPS
jgi:hypothetical protein